MSKEKKWEIINKVKIKNEKVKIEDIVKVLLANRNLNTKKEVEEFLHADLSTVTPKTVGIDQKQLNKTIARIQEAIAKKQQIVVFGDYDVDGITGTAILWETLYALGAMVVPYIPSRMDEGYGLSIVGISNLKSQISDVKVIITVDNGIVANEAVDFANKEGIDVIVTDHHTIGEKLPKAFAIVHTTKVCGAAVGWLLSKEIKSYFSSEFKGRVENSKDDSSRLCSNNNIPKDHLSLVALATVADLVPLTGANRILLRFGLAELHHTTRPGLLALCNDAKIEPGSIGVYEIGHMIAPRLNAMGRLESAMDSLRLLCTKDRMRAKVLADTLNRTNKERQLLTQSASLHAIEAFRGKELKKILFIAHEEYEEGVIGLVAGRLVEEYYLPAIVLSKGESLSKASARSISGFNIIEFIRTSSELLVNAGGHPMAAGFTIETKNIALLQKALEKLAEEKIDRKMVIRVLRIDCALPLEMVTQNFFLQLQQLGPFGMGNPEPTFVSKVVVQEVKTVGAEKKHLKLRVSSASLRTSSQTGEAISKDRHASLAMTSLEAIAFNMGDMASVLKSGDTIDIVYTISENVWNGRVSLQLKIKDIKIV